MEPYSTPTCSGSGDRLSHHIASGWGLVRAFALAAALVLPALAGLGPARAEEEVKADDLVIGQPGAKCTILEYASLGCIHCAHFHETQLPKLKADYLDTGKARLVQRDFPLDGPSVTAAQVARCAGPMRRAGYVALFFQAQGKWHVPGPEARDEMAKVARQGGMTREQFEQCVADKSIGDAVLQSRLDAVKRFGIEGTPTFVVGGKTLPAKPTYEEFKADLDKACGF